MATAVPWRAPASARPRGGGYHPARRRRPPRRDRAHLATVRTALGQGVSPPTPLELVLPIGRAESAATLGAGASERLRAQGGGGPAELVIVAPNRAEAETPGWMEESISQAIAAAAPGA